MWWCCLWTQLDHASCELKGERKIKIKKNPIGSDLIVRAVKPHLLDGMTSLILNDKDG